VSLTVSDVQHGGSIAHNTSSYVGIDRRRDRSTTRPAIDPREIAAFVVLLTLVGLGLPSLLSNLPSIDAAMHAQSALRTTWSVLFVCAGLFRLVRWRLTGETPMALLGVAMVSFGLLSAPTAAFAQLIHDSQRDIILSPVTRAVAVTAFLITLGRSFRSAPVDARVSPKRSLVLTLLLATGAIAIAIATAQLGAPIALPDSCWMAIGISDTVAWLALFGVAVSRGIRQKNASYVWTSLGLLTLATAEMLHALAFVGPAGIAFYSTCLHVVAGAVALTNSAADLGLVFSAEGNRMLSLSGALYEAEELRTEEEQFQEERLHDARSVIAALKAASITLDRYDERLDHAVKHSLRTSLVSELARLERVIDGRRTEPLQSFRLDVALGPVLTAERENGLVITNKLGSVKALGQPLEIATVVQNLLVNARRYAPGSTVRISATSSNGRVQVLVEDRGPGVDPTQHELVFQRGYRCQEDGEKGSGLGLYLARRLMREQGGEIVLRSRDGGGASFVLTLRAASRIDQSKNGLEVVQPLDGVKEGLSDEGHGAALARLPRQRDDDASGGRATIAVGDEKVHHAARRRNRNLHAT
jgi:signal transduction histidine kinase